MVNWKDLEEYVNWGIILMYGGAICLGHALESSGGVKWIADLVFEYPESWTLFVNQTFGLNLSTSFMFAVVASFIALVLSELISNVAVVAILLPVGIGLAQSFGINPVVMAYVIAIPAGLATMFAISTPAMALAHSSGYLRVKDLMIPGLVMNFTAWLIFVLVMAFYWPMIGIQL